MCLKVKNILYNHVPENEEDILGFFDMLELMAGHIKKGMKFRIIIEELESAHLPPSNGYPGSHSPG